MSCADHRIYLELEVRRVDCRQCGAVKRERLDFLVENALHTKRFALYVGRRCRSGTIRDVATVLQRAEMVRRISEEIEGYIIELGSDGRLVLLQLEELMGGVGDDRRLVAKDYFVEGADLELQDVMEQLSDLDTEQLVDLREVAGVLRLPTEADLDTPVQPRGFRLLHKVPRLPETVADHVVDRFSSLQKIMRAGVTDLVEVEGVGEARARAIKEGLSRLAETSILERYV